MRSKIHCPTASEDCKITVERAIESLKRREQRKTSKEFKEKMAEGFIKGVELMEHSRKIEIIKQQNYDKLISDIENKKIGYGSISSLMLTDKQLNYLRGKYLVAKTNKFGGSNGVFYLVCKG